MECVCVRTAPSFLWKNDLELVWVRTAPAFLGYRRGAKYLELVRGHFEAVKKLRNIPRVGVGRGYSNAILFGT